MVLKIPIYIAVAVISYCFGVGAYYEFPRNVPEYCNEGEFLNIEGKKCESCPDGHYMPDRIHSQIRCYACSHPTPSTVEKIVKPCTNTTNTFIGCGDGFFLQPAAVDLNFDPDVVRCYPCSDCAKTVPASHQILPCNVFRDTLCCPDPNMVPFREDGQPFYTCQQSKLMSPNRPYADQPAVLQDDNEGRSGSRDQETYKSQGRGSPYGSRTAVFPVKCHRGEFLKKGAKDSCQECPDGTFMNVESHTNVECKPCTYDKTNKHDIIGCVNKKERRRVIACSVDNMYVDLSVAGKDPTLARCKYCRSCSESTELPFVGRPCSNKTDRVCCAKPNVKVEDRDGEGVCTNVSLVPPDATASPQPTTSQAQSGVNGMMIGIIGSVVGFVTCLLVIVLVSTMCFLNRRYKFCTNDQDGVHGHSGDVDKHESENMV